MPPAKKRRIDTAQSAEDADDMSSKSHIININNNTNTTKLLEQHRDTLKTLRSNISELATATTSNTSTNRGELLLSSSIALSTLKSLQRQISLSVEGHANTSKLHRENIEECSLTLENLNYEHNYLRDEISSMKEWKADELEKMAWKELGLDPSKLKKQGEDDNDKMDTNEKITTAEEAIDTYLLGEDSTVQSKSYRDPSNHTLILNKLQSNLETRSTLVQQLSQSKLQLKELQKKRDTYRNFLNSIPKKLVELEKVGESLNNFFSGSNVWKDVLNDSTDGDTAMGDDGDDDAKMKKVQAANLLVNSPSFDRTKRFELAQSNLPSPLYVLYVQLVGYLDAWASLEKLGGTNAAGSAVAGEGDDNKKSTVLDEFVGANGMDVSAVPPEGEEASDGTTWNVVLTLSSSDLLPPEIGSILGKSYASRSTTASSIKIVFSFNKEEGVVYASVKDDEGSNEGLLDNLFPGDDGNANPNVSLSILQDEDDDDADSDEGEEQAATKSASESKNGKPYYWCQVLGGLNFPPPSSSSTLVSDEKESDSPFKIQTCTKAVFRQLLRRIRARKTLAAILEYLNKRSQLQALPIHPTMKSEDDNQPQSIKTKLHSWAEDSKDKSKTTKSYVATIKRKSSTLKATAVVDIQKYPAEPPVWSLQNEDGSAGTLSSWGEEHGSVSSLQQNATNNNSSSNGAPPLFDAGLNRIECHVNEGLDKFVRQDVEHTYDWILLHQLADIVACWDEVISASEGSSNSRGNKGEMSGRMHKGKDRRLVSFGERSLFSWYRNGL